MSGLSFDLSGWDIPGAQGFIEANLQDVCRKIVLDAHANIVRACPVDTGFARSTITYVEPTSPYSGGEVQSNCVYMPVLEDGHSKQAPNGFWRQGLEAASFPFV